MKKITIALKQKSQNAFKIMLKIIDGQLREYKNEENLSSMSESNLPLANLKMNPQKPPIDL